MNRETTGSVELSDEEFGFGILQDLERQTSDKIRQQREYNRITMRAKVTLQSGNSSELLDYKITGVTGDISEGGCGAVFPIPVTVGDVYRIQFDREQLNLPLVFARCLRCKLIREDAYEAGFRFFTKLSLSKRDSQPPSELTENDLI